MEKIAKMEANQEAILDGVKELTKAIGALGERVLNKKRAGVFDGSPNPKEV